VFICSLFSGLTDGGSAAVESDGSRSLPPAVNRTVAAGRRSRELDTIGDLSGQIPRSLGVPQVADHQDASINVATKPCNAPHGGVW